MSSFACATRNSAQVGPDLRGAGSTRASAAARARSARATSILSSRSPLTSASNDSTVSGDRHRDALQPGEGLADVEWLGEEALDLPGARRRHAVLLGHLVDPEDGDADHGVPKGSRSAEREQGWSRRRLFTRSNVGPPALTWSSPLESHLDDVAESVAEHVERDDGQHDGNTRGIDEPPVAI